MRACVGLLCGRARQPAGGHGPLSRVTIRWITGGRRWVVVGQEGLQEGPARIPPMLRGVPLSPTCLIVCVLTAFTSVQLYFKRAFDSYSSSLTTAGMVIPPPLGPITVSLAPSKVSDQYHILYIRQLIYLYISHRAEK